MTTPREMNDLVPGVGKYADGKTPSEKQTGRQGSSPGRRAATGRPAWGGLEEKLEGYELAEFASVHHFQHSLEGLSHQGGAHLAVADVKLQGPGHPVQAGADTRGHPESLP